MQFAVYVASPYKSTTMLIAAIQERASPESWIIEDIDPDEVIQLLSETELTSSNIQDLILICNYAIDNTRDTVVKKPHWQIVKDWLVLRQQ